MADQVTDEELDAFIKTSKKIMWNPEYRERLEANRICLTPARFYNEIPLLDEIQRGFEATEASPYNFPFFQRDTIIRTLADLEPFAAEVLLHRRHGLLLLHSIASPDAHCRGGQRFFDAYCFDGHSTKWAWLNHMH